MLQKTEFIWLNGQFVRWDDAKVHVLAHTLHYGGGAFEGIRAYRASRGTAVFRLQDHLKRLMYSSKVMGMTLPYSEKEIFDAVIETVKRNKVEACYIRPLVYYGYGIMGLKPFGAPVEAMIACWPWGAYLPEKAVDIVVSKYIRVHERSMVVDAKICGHYVNSMLGAIEVSGTKYHEALFLDARGNIAEGPGENFFAVKGKKLITPKLGTILPGFTRDTVMQLAPALGLTVEQRDVTVDEALKCDEAFFTGTAAEVNGIRSINDTRIGAAAPGPVTEQIASAYRDVVLGNNPTFLHFLSFV